MRGGKRGGPRTGKQSIDLAEKQLSPKSSKQLEAVNSQKGPHKQITESKLAKNRFITEIPLPPSLIATFLKRTLIKFSFWEIIS